jgi:hypothetical protein
MDEGVSCMLGETREGREERCGLTPTSWQALIVFGIDAML